MRINQQPHRLARGRGRIVVPLAAFAVSAAFATSAVTSAAPSAPDYADPTTEAMATETTAAAAEGSDAEGTEAEGTAAGGTAAADEAASLPVGGTSAGVAETAIGRILVDGDGLTLYAFMNDTDGEAKCVDDCAVEWPPAVVEGDPDVGELDASLFSTVDHPDGSVLRVGNWPLYRFDEDTAPGDINGQGVDDFFVVTPNGNPVSLVTSAETSLGEVLVDAQGMTLYAFSNDVDGEPTCVDDCAGTWPPVIVGESGESGESGSSVPGSGAPDAAAADELMVGDLDPTLFSVVEHPMGPMLKIGDYPLYRFSGDTAPGDVNGQAVGDVWWAVAPDGTLIEG